MTYTVILASRIPVFQIRTVQLSFQQGFNATFWLRSSNPTTGDIRYKDHMCNPYPLNFINLLNMEKMSSQITGSTYGVVAQAMSHNLKIHWYLVEEYG